MKQIVDRLLVRYMYFVYNCKYSDVFVGTDNR